MYQVVMLTIGDKIVPYYRIPGYHRTKGRECTLAASLGWRALNEGDMKNALLSGGKARGRFYQDKIGHSA